MPDIADIELADACLAVQAALDRETKGHPYEVMQLANAQLTSLLDEFASHVRGGYYELSNIAQDRREEFLRRLNLMLVDRW
jgi:hypothetical protein